VGVVETKPNHIRDQRIIGYVTFVGTKMGNKEKYNSPALTDYEFRLDGKKQDDKPPVEVEEGSFLRFNFDNLADTAQNLTYRFFNEADGPESGKTEGFVLSDSDTFQSLQYLANKSGNWKLQVLANSVPVLEQVYKVIKDK
jgi:hypothetical protein